MEKLKMKEIQHISELENFNPLEHIILHTEKNTNICPFWIIGEEEGKLISIPCQYKIESKEWVPLCENILDPENILGWRYAERGKDLSLWAMFVKIAQEESVEKLQEN